MTDNQGTSQSEITKKEAWSLSKRNGWQSQVFPLLRILEEQKLQINRTINGINTIIDHQQTDLS